MEQDDPYDGRIMIISTQKRCQEAFGYLSECTALALDCEGVHLSRTGRLCLVQARGGAASSCMHAGYQSIRALIG